MDGVREIQGPVVSRPDPTWLADAYRKQKASATCPLNDAAHPTNRSANKSGGFSPLRVLVCLSGTSVSEAKRGYLGSLQVCPSRAPRSRSQRNACYLGCPLGTGPNQAAERDDDLEPWDDEMQAGLVVWGP